MDIEKVKYHLKEIVNTSLYGPGGDPSWENLNAAKHAYLALQNIDPGYFNKDDEFHLRGENVYEEDFLSYSDSAALIDT